MLYKELYLLKIKGGSVKLAERMSTSNPTLNKSAVCLSSILHIEEGCGYQ